MASADLENVGLGVLAAVLAAALFAAVLSMGDATWRTDPASAALQAAWFVGYGVVLSSWFVVPLGAALGYFLPRHILYRSRRSALLVSGIVGVVVGVFVALSLKVMYREFQAGAVALLTVPYCVVALVVISWWLRGRGKRFVVDQGD